MIRQRTNRTSSIRVNIIILFFFLIISPFVIFAYYSYQKSVESISNANTSFVLDFLSQSKHNLDNYLKNLNDKMNTIIGSEAMQELMHRTPRTLEEERNFASDLLSLINREQTNIDAFRVRVYPLDPVLYRAFVRNSEYGNDVEGQIWFEEQKQIPVPAWHLFLPADYPLLFSTPVMSRTKRFTGLTESTPRGIIAVDITRDQLQPFFSELKHLEGQAIFLLDHGGSVLYHSNPALVGKPFPSAALTERTVQEEGTLTMDVDRAQTLVVYVQLAQAPWTLVSTIPMSSMTKPIKHLDKLTLLFLLVYLLSCVGVIIYITLAFTNPVIKLVHMMRKLENGIFHLQLPKAARKDEIGWLFQGFERMSNKIRELIDEVYRSEKSKKELEFQVLSHQINPHFLYNTLESIRWKAESHRMKDISEMVASLGNLLRLSLNQGKDLTTVEREINHVKAYIQIERARLDHPLRIILSLDEDIMELPFLRLLLQPLVENAIHHGIRDKPENGKIILTGRRDGNDLVFELSDNGVGIPESVIRAMHAMPEPDRSGSGKKGVGLSNVNERLILYFGEKYRLRVESESDRGSRILLRHPVLPSDS